MKLKLNAFLRKLIHDESGQVVAWSAFCIFFALGVAGLVVDVGDAYYQERLLQSSTDAAALAGAQGLPSATTPQANATTFSSLSGNLNAFTNVYNVTMTATPVCLSSLTTKLNLPCLLPANSPTGANAIRVVQTAKVPTFFVSIFGITSVPISATALATLHVESTPANIALILDTTASMGSTSDTSCGTGMHSIDCAKAGAQSMLEVLGPCVSQTASCTPGAGGGSQVRISLFTFPNIAYGNLSDDYCPSSNPTIPVYTMPSSTATSTTGYPPTGFTPTSSWGTYQITPFVTNYRVNDESALNASSDLVQAVGGLTVSTGCKGMTTPGGDGTYYAGVIYAATAALLAEQQVNIAAEPKQQNIIILVSDGAATSAQSQMAGTATATGLYRNGGVDTGSYKDECGQAITAAAYATSQNIRFITAAFGAANTGCSTDTVTSVTYNTSPCLSLKAMASVPATDFYADGGSACTSAVSTAADTVQELFGAIAASINQYSRLVPDASS